MVSLNLSNPQDFTEKTSTRACAKSRKKNNDKSNYWKWQRAIAKG